MFTGSFAENFQPDNTYDSQLRELQRNYENISSRISELERNSYKDDKIKKDEKNISGIKQDIINLYGLIDTAFRNMSSFVQSQIESVFTSLNNVVITMKRLENTIQSQIFKLQNDLIEEKRQRIQEMINLRKTLNEQHVIEFQCACKDGNVNRAIALFNSFQYKAQFIEVLIDAHYKKDEKDDLDKVFRFINELNDNECQAKAYQKISSIIKRDQMLRLGYYLKEFMNSSKYSRFDSNFKKFLENSKSNLPESVQKIYWDSFVYLRNDNYNEPLYAADYQPYDEKRRRVLTWIRGNTDDMCKWKFEPYECGKRFKIFNVYQKEYLYRSNVQLNSSKNFVFTSITHEYWSFWQIYLHEKDNSKIYIRDDENQNYLFACENTHDSIWKLDFNKLRRHALCWSGCNCDWSDNEKRLWKVI